MALQPYTKQQWVDHQVDEATSEIIVLGTPADKIHFDHLEDGIQTADARAIEALGGVEALQLPVADNTKARHTHGNKGVLDGITAALVTTWNTITSKADKAEVSEQLSQKVSQETGNWTPGLAGTDVPGNFTYSRQYGKYIKIGNAVTISCDLAISNVLQAPVGDAILTGLPFATSWLNHPATVGYVKGGHGETMRKITQGSISDARIIMRGIVDAIIADGIQINGLTALTFANNTSDNFIKINTGANDIVLFIGATYII